MDAALAVKALILGLVEGLTEFLPISSTGHLILAGHLLGWTDQKAKLFEVVIQTGAMLAVVWEYRARFFGALAGLARDPGAQRFALHVAIAFLPAGVLGALFASAIKEALFRPVPVAAAFVVGGLVILLAERLRPRVRVESVDDMRWHDAAKIGLAQCLALVPGTSRAGATIIGGLLFGLSRRAATEFSFFLAVPTLIGAGVFDLVGHRHLLEPRDFGPLLVGSAVAFVSAYACIRWLLRFVATHDFTPFAWYRIAFGALVLATAWSGLVDWTAG
jgi:undecaprenyl-diphosphatase